MRNLIKKILTESDDLDWIRDIVNDDTITKDNVEVGMRVRINPDSKFVQQAIGNHGTVSDINADDFPGLNGTYWVHVQWDGGRLNSYRVGDTAFDLLFSTKKTPIKESDDWDWVREIDPRPEIELTRLYDVDNDHIDEFLQAVEYSGKGIRWASGGSPTSIYMDTDRERGSTVIEINKDGAMFYWSNSDDWDWVVELEKYSPMIKWPQMLKNINESDDLDWIRNIVSDERITKDNVEVGMRVRMNPDSEFVRQTKPNGHGTVSHINANDFPDIYDVSVERYWVCVNWDDGEHNSYRVGGVEFDLLFPTEKPPITESDELDWIRTTEVNPWVEYDGIHFDIEPSREDVFKYIEMVLNSYDVINSDDWKSPYKDDIDSIIEYFRNKKIVYLVMDNRRRLSYGTALIYWIDGSELNLIKYSQLNDGGTITESDGLEWIRTTESPRIQKNESYIMTTYDLQQFLTTVERELPKATWCSGDKPTQYTPIPAKLKNSKKHYIKIIINNYDKLSYSHSGSEDFSNSTNWP